MASLFWGLDSLPMLRDYLEWHTHGLMGLHGLRKPHSAIVTALAVIQVHSSAAADGAAAGVQGAADSVLRRLFAWGRAQHCAAGVGLSCVKGLS